MIFVSESDSPQFLAYDAECIGRVVSFIKQSWDALNQWFF